MGSSSRTLQSLAAAAALVLLCSGVVGIARGDAMVTGSVFCDRCRDGERSLFDFPLYGAKVAVACAGGDGKVASYKEDTTNWFGNYAVRFDGSPDLSGCFAQVTGGPSGCESGVGPARGLNLLFRMFDMEVYTVDALLSEPAQPMGFCPGSSTSPSPSPAPPGFGAGGPALPVPSPPGVGSHPPPFSVSPLLPVPSPPDVGSRAPPLPFLQASACPYEKWTMPEYRCYWKVVGPDTKVAVAFGLIAAQKYGTDMSLWDGLQGRGELYETLLREATTALLNSYNSIEFFYPTLSVLDRMNWALLGSPQQALMIALRFRRANSGASGGGNLRCNFNPCN